MSYEEVSISVRRGLASPTKYDTDRKKKKKKKKKWSRKEIKIENSHCFHDLKKHTTLLSEPSSP